jgi:beta-glucanase (GH16 family)
MTLRHLIAGALCLAPGALFAAVVNLSTSHDFAAPANIGASASTQLTGLASLADFQATTSADRYVYSFETWAEAVNNLGANPYTFQFDLDGNGSTDQRVTFKATASFNVNLTKGTSANASSPSTWLNGLGDMGWSGYQEHVISFETPVKAVGLVYRSAQNLLLRRDIWNSANYPVSYTLTDGSVVNLGAVGQTGATLAANTNNFVSVIDSSGKGIVSIAIRLKGTNGGASQWTNIDDLCFVSLPEAATQNPISLKASHAVRVLSNITANASAQLPSLMSLAEFRTGSAMHNRFVYSFNTWPQAASGLGASTYTFQFDLDGNGSADQNVGVTYTGPYSGSQFLTKASSATASSPGFFLGGLGDIGWGGSTHAQHTFTFSKPVRSMGVVYRSGSDVKLQRTGYNADNYPVSYTLSDGTVVNLGTLGGLAATFTANTNTFVGVRDTTGKGISSVTFRVRGTAGGVSQYAYIDDLVFDIAGPPAGNWTVALDENFNGTSLNTAVWSKGYRWAPVINNELQAFRPENVTIGGGLCTLYVEKRTAQNQDMNGYNGQTQQYASGAIQTYNKWRHGYGYFEARMRMSSARGTWPAFWLLPDRGPTVTPLDWRVGVGNPGGTGMGNEIDVVEYMGSWLNPTTGLSKMHSGYFWNYSGGSSGDYGKENNGTGPVLYYPNPDTEFHNYGVLYQPGKLTFYLDGKIVLVREGPNVGTVPHYLILNCALHTNDWTGTAVNIADIDADLPSNVEIDWVRVWAGAPY